MPTDNDTDETESDDTEEKDETVAATTGGGKNVTVPTAAMKRIKEEARERGRREAAAEFDAKLAEHNKAMSTRLEELTAQIQGKSGSDKAAEEKRQSDAAAKARARVEMERDALAKKARNEERARKAERAAAEAREAEYALRETAIISGVKDVDVTMELLKKHISRQSPEELAKFDEGKWFEQLKKDRPYLFGAAGEVTVQRPANTGTGGTGDEPNKPKPGQVQGADTPVDVRDMKRDAFEAEVRKLGLVVPSS